MRPVRPIYNAASQVKTQPIFDADGRIVRLVETQPASLVDKIQQLAREQEENRKPLAGNTQRHWRRVAELPNTVVNMLMRKGIWGDKEAVLKWIQTEGREWMPTRGSF